MCWWVPGEPGPSPDRLDALVWGMSELLVEEKSLDLQVWLELGKNPAPPLGGSNKLEECGSVFQGQY